MINVFHTVPFEGITKMTRNSDRVKVDQNGKPIAPLGKWLKHTKSYNTLDTPILGAIAGQDFIGIDIDNSLMFNGLISLLTDTEDDDIELPTYVAMSMPADANKGGHVLFSFDKTADHIKQILVQLTGQFGKIKVDVQMNNKLIYLATPANTTKRLMTPLLGSLEELTPLTADVLVYLESYLDLKTLSQTAGSVIDAPETFYGYLLTSTLTPNIVKALTPRATFPNITTMDDIPRGSATEWLLKVRKKLQVDQTVSEEVFTTTIRYLNTLWSHPRGPSAQLEADIDRDVRSPDFKFNDTWETNGLTFPNMLGQTIGVYYAHKDDTFIQHNTVTDEVDSFMAPAKCINSITSIHQKRIKLKPDNLLKKAQPITLVDTPEEKPRLSHPDPDAIPIFNLYTPSEGTRLIKMGETIGDYREPVTILAFLKHLIPDTDNRIRLMKFMAHKHRTYEPSPLYFVFAGVGGAGKGLFVNLILKYLSGEQRMMSDDLQGITNNFNEHLATIDYLEIEEAGEGYTKRESNQLVAELKKLTGSPYLTIEGKGAMKKKVRHYITPVISSNIRTKLITSTSSDDRRLVLLRNPHKLVTAIEAGDLELNNVKDTRDLVQLMEKELPHFAYFLSSLETISYKDYTDNESWKSEDYIDYIESSMSYSDRLLQAAELKDLGAFVATLSEAGVTNEAIDMLFSTSIHHKPNATIPARALVYWTNSTKEAGLLSLQEIIEGSTTLTGNAKFDYKAHKTRRTYNPDADTSLAVQVIEFTDEYDMLTDQVLEYQEETQL